jgi:hypothetical protein
MISNMQRIIRNPGFLVLVLLCGLTACAGTEGPALPGRILSMGQCEEQRVTVFEYKESTQSEQPLWTDIPCYIEPPKNTLNQNQNPSKYIRFIASPNGHYILLNMPPAEGMSVSGLVNLVTGQYKRLPKSTIQTEPLEVIGFSPNNSYIAFFETNSTTPHGPKKVLLFDMKKEIYSIAFEVPPLRCASYTPGGTTKCADLWEPKWINDSTLVYSIFTGEMPNKIENNIPPKPNQTIIVTVDGTILQELKPVLDIEGVFGSILGVNTNPHDLSFDTDLSDAWLETDNLINGLIQTNSLKYIPSYFSPDGKYALGKIDKDWFLLELRTGAEKKIHTKAQHSVQIWSPDVKYILSGGMIVSLEGFRDRTLPPFTGQIITWLP